jgi:hypothetical protein
MKKVKLFEEYITEAAEMFPKEIIGNDQILFKKEWEKMNGGKLAAKYNQYFKGYDIDFGGRIFNTVDALEKYVKVRELSNNEYNKYKNMPEQSIKEAMDEAKQSIVDYSNSKNKILVGLKTDLLRNMKERYEYKEDGDSIYFFDKEGNHFGTLFDLGTRYQELLHNGTIDDKGWLK